LFSFYDLLHAVLSFLFSALFHLKVKGHENIPSTGGVIIAANHISNWDPPMLGTAMQRHLCAMAKEELFKVPILGYIICKLHAFPVRRGAADRTAISAALKLLKEGKVVLLFPEGTRSKDGKLGEGKPGVALIAAKAGVPIIPAAVIGTNLIGTGKHFFQNVQIQFGKPILSQGETHREALEKVTDEVMKNIAGMLQKDSND
jgi:1-acyl-sn-glycerol-3-phosphate acyltransferase